METLLHVGGANAVLATALAVLAWVVGRAARRPAVTHVLWLLVLLKLVTPPLWTVRIPAPVTDQSALHNVGETEEFEGAGVASEATGDAPPAAEDSGPGHPATNAGATATDRTPVRTNPAKPGEPRPQPFISSAWAKLSSQSWWKPALVALWLTGTLLFWSVAIWRIGWLRQLLRGAQPGSPLLQSQVRSLAERLGVFGPPEVWLVSVPIPPMLWAVLGRPRLLLPAQLWERLSEEQRETLLVHELTHLRGRDHWVRRLELLALGLYWWHPVAWWARRELREAEEQRCDAWVVHALPASAAAYAQTLLDTVAFLSRARCVAPVGASSMGQVRVLKRRLTMILQGSNVKARSQTWAWVVLGLGALLLPLMPTWAQPQPERGTDKGAVAGPQRETQTQGAPVKREAADRLLLNLHLAAKEQPRSRGREKSADDIEGRLQQLEKQLDALRQEISMLRREQRGARVGNRRFQAIDLQPWANQSLDETFHSGEYPGNNLASLPRGNQTLDGIQFNIGKAMLQLGASVDKPEKIEGVKVGRRAARLYLLHATGYTREDDTQIAEYTIHFDDGTSATIPVVYGKDVLDWWKYSFCGEPTRGKVVWIGENEPAKKEYDATIRLYMTTWENPKPNVRITSIDYATSNNEMRCAPFCVAISAE